MLEQIYVKDYVCDAEIGVFESEYGLNQRLMFNITLDVDYSNVIRSDNLSDVLSYEIIIEAINKYLSEKRLNLLETLADNICNYCLLKREVKMIDIRIEKLDRINGSLGVRLVRRRE
ncbi:MAG: dihydroneopterin aldolase [Rhodobacteraceae bacterium]|nr:dihydroneopterin aldolase [Paracoccaceae bacterium]